MTIAMRTPTTIIKRSGQEVPFDIGKIDAALTKCFAGLGQAPETPIEQLALRVTNIVAAQHERTGAPPTVEGVQDIVEMVLQAAGEYDAAKAYILYRAEHERQRAERPIPEDVRAAFELDEQFFPTALQRFQFYDKYSRFDYDRGRRETYVEAVDRVVAQLHRLTQGYGELGSETFQRIRSAMLAMRAMPSMRMMSMAGPAFERDNATQYNCTYLPIDGIDAWAEAMWLSMAGCGVGFSVEQVYVDQFPKIRRQRAQPRKLHVIEDSSQGWCEALKVGCQAWFEGDDVAFDYSLIRPRGAILRIKGGRASGPEPLQRLLDFTRKRILSRQGTTLRPIDAHDITCAVGSAAVSGGVRRTAMISIFDYDDHAMLTAKSGDFERENSQRWNANNSTVWDDLEGLTQDRFVGQFMEMVRSGRGEPGIFNREAARTLMPPRRFREDADGEPIKFGSNPCGEIILRPWGMCNLTAAVARADDTYDSLAEKVEVAAIIGTIQSLGTHFPYLRPQWKQNCEEERLLGVDITGQMDCPMLTGPAGPAVMSALRQVAVKANERTADSLGIFHSAAVTTVKPSGNISQLLDCSSGIHARWAPYYIRNVRVSGSSALSRVLRDAGAPMQPENGDDPVNPHTWVVSFPVKAPEGAITRNDRSAIEQCEYWLRNKLHWTEHNPSVTITYKPDEVIDLMKWVWEHRQVLGGMAFLPSFDQKYDQLPYIEIDREEYERRVAEFPEIDFAKVYRYESEDWTTASMTPACDGPVCEVEA
jgi:ribonucleoside-triphosphate reductase (thioredoxin)